MGTDIIFDIKMVATDKNNRRGGLGTDLLRRSVQLASSLGYKVGGCEMMGAVLSVANLCPGYQD